MELIPSRPWLLLFVCLPWLCTGSTVLYTPKMEGIQADVPPGVVGPKTPNTETPGGPDYNTDSRDDARSLPVRPNLPQSGPKTYIPPSRGRGNQESKAELSPGYTGGSPRSEYAKPSAPNRGPEPRLALQTSGPAQGPYSNDAQYSDVSPKDAPYSPNGGGDPYYDHNNRGLAQNTHARSNPPPPSYSQGPPQPNTGQNQILPHVHQPTYPVPAGPQQPGSVPDSGNQKNAPTKLDLDSEGSAFPNPFEFPGGLKMNKGFPFPSPISFESPRPFKSRTPPTFPRDPLLPGFPDPNDAKLTRSTNSRPSSAQPQQNYQNLPNVNTVPVSTYPSAQTVPASSYVPTHPQTPNNYASIKTVPAANNYAPVNNFPPSATFPATSYSAPANPVQGQVFFSQPTQPGAYPSHQRFGNVGGPPAALFGYSQVGNRGAPVGGGQCFQYTYAAEAYRLSDIAKSYPEDAIQRELNKKPYLAPLMGLQASKATESDRNPFSRFSTFDFANFGFEEKENPAEKYSYLANNKAYPGNLNEGDFTGGYPNSMKPLDTSCPSQEYKLRSFFYHGGDCYVVNPEFQQIFYRRCSRRECNFCGVNRGLSACVEDYRWFTVFSYCNKLAEGSRIVPLRLILPVGCTCQHFSC